MTVSPADAVDLDDASSAADAAADATESHAAAEGTDATSTTGMGSRKNLQDMLLSTEPARSLDQVESPWDPDRGGPRRIMRAVQKATGVDGLPAVIDGVLGVLETLSSIEADDDQDDQDDAPGFEPGGDPAP